MALKPSEDETILRVTGALLVMAVVALAGLALVGSLDAVVGLPEAANSAASYGVLDDDHLALFAYHEHNELPRHVGDFLACPVPTGTCRVVVSASETPYVPPGNVP